MDWVEFSALHCRLVVGEMLPSIWYHSYGFIMRKYQLVHVWHAAHLDTQKRLV